MNFLKKKETFSLLIIIIETLGETLDSDFHFEYKFKSHWFIESNLSVYKVEKINQRKNCYAWYHTVEEVGSKNSLHI